MPAVVTLAVPTKEERATTKDVATYSMARPWIHVVAVEEPEMVLGSTLKEDDVNPV